MSSIQPSPHCADLHGRARTQHGYILIWLLFLLAGMGAGLASIGSLWHTASQREKEQQLLFIGDQYRRSIESFWQASPGAKKRLPESLDELLVDPRFPNTVRHLRRIYADPITGKPEWGLVRDTNGGIIGVHSLSDRLPYKSQGFPDIYATFTGKTEYREWVFAAAMKSEQPRDANRTPEVTPVDPARPIIPDQTIQPVAKPGVPDTTQLSRIACLEAREQATAECFSLEGRDQQDCNTEAFRNYRKCLSGNL